MTTSPTGDTGTETAEAPAPTTVRTWKRGQGAIRKKGRDFYIRYCVAGKRYEEKVAARTKTEAQAFLRTKLAKVDKGGFQPAALTLRVRDLFQRIVNDYFIKGQNANDPPQRWKHLEPVFGSMKARDVKMSHIKQYCADRLAKDQAAPATVQKEISCLRRMFNIALEEELLDAVPAFPQVEIDGLNARKGFFEDEDFYAVCAALPPHLRVLAIMAFWTGARKGELLKLQWSSVNLTTGKVELGADITKGKTPRSFFLPTAALDALRSWKQTTREWEFQHQTPVPSVFHRNGKPIKKFQTAWNKAFQDTGVERRVFHDLRRTAVRNYVDTGTAKSIAREISGHKTEKVFERYNIRDNDKDKLAAAQAISQRASRDRNGAVMGKLALLESV